LIDDYSTDDTVKYLENKHYKFYKNSINLGFTKTINKGIRLAKGEYVCILDHDIVYDKDYLNNMLKRNSDITSGRYYYYNEKDKIRALEIKIDIFGRTKITGRDEIDKGQYYNSLIDYALATKFLPNNGARYCTAEFKIKPIDNFLKSQGNCELMIGFNYDEKDRAGNMEKIRNVTYSYPLITDEFDRSDCENILKNYGVHPTFPAYMSRGGCKMCYFKSENEYKAMYYLNRKEFNEIKELEQKIQDKKTNFFSIMPNGKSLQQLENELKNTLDLDFISMYKSKEKTCGAFCRR
jgi:glycosyltransferase involved in cell wall biosynthesis